MLVQLKARLDRAWMFARVLRQTKVMRLVPPRRLAHLARSVRRATPGPHIAVMYNAAAHPEKEAVVEYGTVGVRRLSWRELDQTINRVADALAQRGVQGEGRVALMLPNGIEFLLAQHALARLGATAVQIGYRLKPAEIAYILENARPVATIVAGDLMPAMRDARRLAGARDPMLVVSPRDASDLVEADDWARALADGSPELPPIASAGDGGGLIVYTSGTTGKPKGAARAWRKTGLESVADMIYQVGMTADDRHLVTCPLYHSGAPAFVAIMLTLGATVVLQTQFDPEQALEIIERERVTCTLMVPTMMIRMCALPAAALAKHDTSSLRWVMSGAAPLSTDAARRFMAQFGPILWNFYGSTETGLVTLAGPGDHVGRPGTIGRQLRGNEIRLLDDRGAPVPLGQIGELFTRNPMLISGYHGNASATSDAQRDGFFSVGDVARVDGDGFYYLESRKHDMVISGGVNIYPREIEDHLSTHPAVLEAAVIGVPDPEWGESLRAFVVMRPGAATTEAVLIDFCRQHLADFKRPRKVTFLVELPRNPTGKILKRELRERVEPT